MPPGSFLKSPNSIAFNERRLILVDSAICSSEMPRFRRIVANPKILLSNIASTFPSVIWVLVVASGDVTEYTVYRKSQIMLPIFSQFLENYRFGRGRRDRRGNRLLNS